MTRNKIDHTGHWTVHTPSSSGPCTLHITSLFDVTYRLWERVVSEEPSPSYRRGIKNREILLQKCRTEGPPTLDTNRLKLNNPKSLDMTRTAPDHCFMNLFFVILNLSFRPRSKDWLE